MTEVAGSGRVRVVLVDDHAMVREALAAIIEGDERFEIVGLGGDRHDAFRITAELRPDVLVLDYGMPGGGALPAIEDIVRLDCETRILVLTVHASIHYAVKVLEAGACGFMVKSSSIDELIKAIRKVHRDDFYVAPQFNRAVIAHLRRPKSQRVGLDALSSREFELLHHLAQGKSLTATAEALGVSTSTVSTYRTRCLAKLNLNTTAELIRFALENDVVG